MRIIDRDYELEVELAKEEFIAGGGVIKKYPARHILVPGEVRGTPVYNNMYKRKWGDS